MAPATHAVKVKVTCNEVGLRLLCFPYIHLFVVTRHDIKTDQFSNDARVFLCISEGTMSLENVRCHYHIILHALCQIKQRL